MCAIPVFSQGESSPCFASGEMVYDLKPDIRPPKLRMERKSPDGSVSLSSPVVLELTVNAAGKICDAKALAAPDQQSAKHFVEYVTDNFRFSPATRKGRPVAVRFQVKFQAKR